MSVETGGVGLVVLLVLLMLQVPVAIALIVVSFGGIYWMLGLGPAVGILNSTPYEFTASWTLSAVPMFLLMGFVAFHSGMTKGLFEGAKLILRRVPGGLGIASVMACAGFASVSGSSIATAAAMGRMAIPEMLSVGYRPSFAAGTLAAGGTVGALIPPSILMIVYGVFAETSVTKVFLGGISIGLMTAFAYSLLILVVAWLRPSVVPRQASGDERVSARSVLSDIWPLVLLIILLFGGMFGGIFSATEAGAIGAAGATVISAVIGRLSWRAFRIALLETLSTSATLFVVGVGAVMFTKFLGLSGVGNVISAAVNGLDFGYHMLMLVIVLLFLVIGMFLEPFGAMLITLPILLPILQQHGVSLVWFGVFLVKLLEVGMVTPPLGMNVYVIRSVAAEHVSLTEVFRGVFPFIVVDLMLIAVMVAFPQIVLYLPGG